jgi:hypothetical protein
MAVTHVGAVKKQDRHTHRMKPITLAFPVVLAALVPPCQQRAPK